MLNQFSRTELLLGKAAMEQLSKCRVAVFGIGGVGGYVCEALVRSGISHITIVDNDDVSITNINRQIIATHNTIGASKVDVMRDRILSINPNCEVLCLKKFYLPDNASEFDFTKYDYVIDCVDTVSAKISIVCEANRTKTRVISAMGAGNKLNPTDLMVSDIYKTEVDPLARVMRYELKKRRIKHLKVVYSKEVPIKTKLDADSLKEIAADQKKRSIPGSISFVPSVMGLIIASEVIKDLM